MPQDALLVNLLPLILIFVVFYFLLIRPQQKRMRDHQNMLAAIRRGDKVVTGGGIIATVTRVGADGELTLQIAPDIEVKALQSTIANVLGKPQPVNENTPPAKTSAKSLPKSDKAAGQKSAQKSERAKTSPSKASRANSGRTKQGQNNARKNAAKKPTATVKTVADSAASE